MYIPYARLHQRHESLSFVTVFTFGELARCFALATIFDGGVTNVLDSLEQAKRAVCCSLAILWVFGDLFQTVRRPNTSASVAAFALEHQSALGLAGARWCSVSGALGESRALIIGGSLLMIAEAVAISFAEAPADEQRHWRWPWSANAHVMAWIVSASPPPSWLRYIERPRSPRGGGRCDSGRRHFGVRLAWNSCRAAEHRGRHEWLLANRGGNRCFCWWARGRPMEAHALRLKTRAEGYGGVRRKSALHRHHGAMKASKTILDRRLVRQFRPGRDAELRRRR
jgi:hypothetical protein